jgi:hypothetical protein
MRRQSIWILSKVLHNIAFGHLVSRRPRLPDNSLTCKKPKNNCREPHGLTRVAHDEQNRRLCGIVVVVVFWEGLSPLHLLVVSAIML